MIHPSRQAFVEEEPQVRTLPTVQALAPHYLHIPSSLELLSEYAVTRGQEKLTEMAET